MSEILGGSRFIKRWAYSSYYYEMGQFIICSFGIHIKFMLIICRNISNLLNQFAPNYLKLKSVIWFG